MRQHGIQVSRLAVIDNLIRASDEIRGGLGKGGTAEAGRLIQRRKVASAVCVL
jgi:hypothetical protein